MRKYEFTGEEKTNEYGVTVKRIRALVTIAGVVALGDAGGWIASESSLNQSGKAWVSGEAQVFGEAQVSGEARVASNDDWCSFTGFGSAYRTTTAYTGTTSILVTCGCFNGTLDEFRAAVISTHGDNKHARLYLGIANMIELRLTKEPQA